LIEIDVDAFFDELVVDGPAGIVFRSAKGRFFGNALKKPFSVDCFAVTIEAGIIRLTSITDTAVASRGFVIGMLEASLSSGNS